MWQSDWHSTPFSIPCRDGFLSDRNDTRGCGKGNNFPPDYKPLHEWNMKEDIGGIVRHPSGTEARELPLNLPMNCPDKPL